MTQIYFLRRSKRQNNSAITRLKNVHRIVLAEHGTRCHYCRSREYEAFDHIVPRSQGGSNKSNNLVPVCRSCNSAKKAKSYEEFMEFMYVEKVAYWTYLEFSQ